MKKGLYLFLILAMIGCSSTSYEKVARKGYRVSKADNRFLAKEESGLSYYKYNDEEARVYMVIEKNKVSEELRLLLSLEYRGEDWIYMERVDFKGSGEDVGVDFLRAKFEGALVQEIPRASGDVVERVLVPVSEEQLNQLGELLGRSGQVKARYSSRYKDRSAEIMLTPQEKEGLLTMIKLYNKVKGEREDGN